MQDFSCVFKNAMPNNTAEKRCKIKSSLCNESDTIISLTNKPYNPFTAFLEKLKMNMYLNQKGQLQTKKARNLVRPKVNTVLVDLEQQKQVNIH